MTCPGCGLAAVFELTGWKLGMGEYMCTNCGRTVLLPLEAALALAVA